MVGVAYQQTLWRVSVLCGRLTEALLRTTRCLPADRFKEDDLHAILTTTRAAAAKWRAIGIALGFDIGTLKIMEGTLPLVMGGPLALYTELLCRWLRWAPPVHPHPTRGALAAALRDVMVEEDTLAQAVEAKFGGGKAGRDRMREGGRKEKRRMDRETGRGL